jgi:hypothetical protein
LLPDLFDKSRFIFGMAPSTRWLAHSVFFGLALAALAFLFLRTQALPFAILLGSWAHLLLDGEHFLPLFYPVVQYAWPAGGLSLSLDPLSLAFELFGLLSLFFLWRRQGGTHA